MKSVTRFKIHESARESLGIWAASLATDTEIRARLSVFYLGILRELVETHAGYPSEVRTETSEGVKGVWVELTGGWWAFLVAKPTTGTRLFGRHRTMLLVEVKQASDPTAP